MRLRSNFSDVYDYAFDRTGPTLVRTNDASGPSKREQFAILQSASIRTPRTGTVEQLFALGVPKVVAYTDERAHCGDGKDVLVPAMLWDRFDGNPYDLFASEFIGTPGHSFRRLQVGRAAYWLEYRSRDSWMSNVGDGSCEVVDYERDAGYLLPIRYPFFAIDYVADADGKWYGIDFNNAPGVRGSGVEKYLTGAEFVKLLEQAHADGIWQGSE